MLADISKTTHKSFKYRKRTKTIIKKMSEYVLWIWHRESLLKNRKTKARKKKRNKYDYIKHKTSIKTQAKQKKNFCKGSLKTIHRLQDDICNIYNRKHS